MNYIPISTKMSRMYVVIIILQDVNLDGSAQYFHAKVDAHRWHRRIGHCNSRALQQLADKDNSCVKFNGNIESGYCEVCFIANSEKSSHPVIDRLRAQTRLEIVHADVWGKHSVESCRGYQSEVMFTGDKSRMTWRVPIKKYETAEVLQVLVQEVADPEGICSGKAYWRILRDGVKHCVNHLESSSRPTPCTCFKGTPSRSVDLAPLFVLHAASSRGHLTYQTDCRLKFF